jgi:hypothetical protein
MLPGAHLLTPAGFRCCRCLWQEAAKGQEAAEGQQSGARACCCLCWEAKRYDPALRAGEAACTACAQKRPSSPVLEGGVYVRERGVPGVNPGGVDFRTVPDPPARPA